MTHDCSCYMHFGYFDSCAMNLNKVLFVTHEITVSTAVIFASSLFITRSEVELMKITTMLLKASDKNILVFYKVSHVIVFISEVYYSTNVKVTLIINSTKLISK